MNPHAAHVDRRARPRLSGRARGGSVSVIGATDPQRLKPANDFQDLDPRLSARALLTRAHTNASPPPGHHAAACANSLAGRGWLWSVTHEGRR
jgi:hypothetical protein